jgi:hypothetical protein
MNVKGLERWGAQEIVERKPERWRLVVEGMWNWTEIVWVA